MSQTTVHTQLRRNALGVAGIVFLVLAAVAPLTGIVVVASLVIALGNGGGAPVSFFIVAIVLLLFAVGYAQMSKQLVNAGGFYAFVVKGLGRTGGSSRGSSRPSVTTSSWSAPSAPAASSCRS
jgi:amino acid transporter